MVPYRLEKMRPTLFMICSVSINPKVSNQAIKQTNKQPSKQVSNHNQNLSPLIQSHQIAQLLNIKSPQPFFARAHNFFGQH